MSVESNVNHEDIVGRPAFDVDGEKVGEVEYCYLDLDTDLPEWAAVKTGGIASQSRLVPLMDGTMTADGVNLAFSKGQITGAPEVNLDLDLNEAEEAQLFSHYGLVYSEVRSDTGLPAGRAGAARREAGRVRLAKILHPGETASKSGQYEEVGPRGGSTGHEVTVPKGHTMPPTTEPGHGYKLVDPTKNKSGK